MLNIHNQQHIRFGKVETPTAWLVVAVLVEIHGSTTTVISEPRVIKVIPKAERGLPAARRELPGSISLPKIQYEVRVSLIPSPYVTTLFGNNNKDIVVALAARPPTRE
jgi:hypothetical protein